MRLASGFAMLQDDDGDGGPPGPYYDPMTPQWESTQNVNGSLLTFLLFPELAAWLAEDEARGR